MSCWWSLAWSNYIWGNWYLIIWWGVLQQASGQQIFQTDFRKRLFGALFLNSCFHNHLDSAILQNYQWLSNQSFKHNSAHMPSLNLNPKLSFEPWFRMFIINSYCTKKNACSPWTPCVCTITSSVSRQYFLLVITALSHLIDV